MTVREVQRLVASIRQREGGGFLVRRPFPTAALEAPDPFLLLDEMGPSDYGPGEAVGAPDHPHRGFETVTYMLDGEFEHVDSAGNRGTIRAGDVQWMTAGDGVIHSEMPAPWIRERGGRVHGFQLWVNLPARDKRIAPRYQDVRAERMPTWTAPGGGATVKLIAGSTLGMSALAQTRTPITYCDVALDDGASVELDVPAAQAAIVYVFGGRAALGTLLRPARDGDLALLGEGTHVRLAGAAPGTRALLIAGAPLREPTVRYGPFVMNTRDEILAAIQDYQAGRFGTMPAILS